MNELSPKEQILLMLNEHGFLWVNETEKSIAEDLVLSGYAVNVNEWDRGHRMYRYEITYLGIMNANNLKGLLEEKKTT